MVQQGAELSAITNNIENLRAETAEQIQAAVLSLTVKLEQIPELSQTQIQDVCRMVGELQAQVSSAPTQSSLAPKDLPETSSQPRKHYDGWNLDEEEDSTLNYAIERLTQLASAKEGTRYNQEADAIIDDLAHLLKSASPALADTWSSASKKRKVDTITSDEGISRREYKRLCSLIIASHAVDVNIRRE
jgi:hypothetical protein